MVSYALQDFIQTLDELGVADVMLPFLLIFTIVFAVLQNIKIFGEGKKNFNVIIALVIGLSVVIPHVLGIEPDVVVMINQVLPQISLVAVAFLMAMLLAGLVGSKIAGSWISGLFAFIALIAILVIFGGAAGWWESGWMYYWFGEDTIALIIMILVFGLIIWFITKEETTETTTTFGEGIKKFFDMFRGE